MLEISAGAIIYTYINNEINYLVIKDFHGNYGFPKGHIENNETQIEAALREIKEEVGLEVSLDDNFIQELNYVMPNGKDKRSIYYLAEYKDQTPVKQLEEVDEILLLPYNEALNILTFDNMKEVLIKAHEYLNE